jgi:hypothetical protein
MRGSRGKPKPVAPEWVASEGAPSWVMRGT